MAKKSLKYSLRGDLDVTAMTITEVTKDDLKVYDLKSIIEEFDGQPISFSINTDTEVEPLNE